MLQLKMWVGTQAGGILLGLSLLAFYPPDKGRMLLLPLGMAGQGAAVSLAMKHGALLIAAGPLPRSVVIYGSRASIAAVMQHARILIMAAPSAGCGETILAHPG